ncbi:hypothetical protein DH2020_026098 [Rehmannia glutinosa]|uniref:3-deoxy-D-manno-octulosonic-acid transferase N-terminal domain-containing protein n=1 Tax=Rehmannia glutinosa TaxID=99300 RepID=A0ABR0W0R1_REHGL
MATKSGEIVYKIYRALTYGISPLIRLHLRWRRFRGREHPLRWRERLGRPSAPRPTGRLIWFHAVSLGEGLAAIPVIKCCLERRPDVTVLMTTTTTSAFEVIKNRLPSKVIYQFAPLDIPSTMDAFLQYWRPNAVMLMESELWPNLIMSAARNGNVYKIIPKLVSSSNSSIDHIDAIKIFIDSPIAIMDSDISEGDKKSLEEFQAQLSHRKVWMASSIHNGEEEVFIGAHNVLKQKHADIVTIIVPRQPQHGRDIALFIVLFIGLVDSELIMCFDSNEQKLKEEGTCVALRSSGDNPTPETSLYVVDSLGFGQIITLKQEPKASCIGKFAVYHSELRDFYRVAPIAVIGGSFLLGSTGHNISEAAAAGCAVLTGHHVGHFSHMVAEMQRVYLDIAPWIVQISIYAKSISRITGSFPETTIGQDLKKKKTTRCCCSNSSPVSLISTYNLDF